MARKGGRLGGGRPDQGPEELRRRIGAALGARRGKVALDAARALAKSAPGAESEALLLEAYLARVEEMARTDLRADARELLVYVRGRFPAAAARVDRMSLSLDTESGAVEGLLRPLADPALPADRKASLLDLLRTSLRDPADVAGSPALPPDHPLRIEASRAAALLERVAREPLDPDDPAFTAIPRRSVFAPFALLARAVDAAFRGEAAELDRVLSRIPADTAPARLSTALRAIAVRRVDEELGPADRRLVTAILGADGRLSRDLVALSETIGTTGPGKAGRFAVDVYGRIRAAAPGLIPEFRRLLAIEWVGEDFPLDPVERIFGPADCGRGEFFRVMALALEEMSDLEGALGFWNEWIDEQGRAARPAEIGAVRSRQARLALALSTAGGPGISGELIDDLDDDELREVLEDFRAELVGGGETARSRLAEAVRFQEEAVKAAPSPDQFRGLYGLVAMQGDAKERRVVARRWHERFPGNLDAVLALCRAESEVGNGAAALALLDRAAGLAPHDPRIREIRTASVLRELRGALHAGELARAREQIARLDGPGVSADDDLRLLLSAARWFAAEPPDRAAALGALAGAVGEREAAHLLRALAGPLDGGRTVFRLPPRQHLAEPDLTARCLAVAGRAARALSIRLPRDRAAIAVLEEALRGGFVPRERDLVPLADQFAEWNVVAGLHHLSRLGLGRSSAGRHRFLYYRALCLGRTRGDVRRRTQCLAAAAELSVRVGDARTLRDVEAQPGFRRPDAGAVDSEAILAREAAVGPEDVPGPRRRKENPRQRRLF